MVKSLRKNVQNIHFFTTHLPNCPFLKTSTFLLTGCATPMGVSQIYCSFQKFLSLVVFNALDSLVISRLSCSLSISGTSPTTKSPPRDDNLISFLLPVSVSLLRSRQGLSKLSPETRNGIRFKFGRLKFGNSNGMKLVWTCRGSNGDSFGIWNVYGIRLGGRQRGLVGILSKSPANRDSEREKGDM